MAYFRCTTGGSGKGNTLVVTCADDLAGATITCTNGTKTYRKTCPSTAPYEVTFYGLEAGTWTLSATVSGNTYTATVVITDCAALLGGFNWRTWVDTAQFLDSSDYDSLDEVLADELAVRELCLEHACVDYLADIVTANADVETIINNDLFAKWVNNSDYSLDVLGANVVIKALMDDADKYGYGEWVITDNTTTPPTWGAKGNVPVMTANNAPYGTAIDGGHYSDATWGDRYPYYVFNGESSRGGSGHWWEPTSGATTGYVGYKSVNPTMVKQTMFDIFCDSASAISCTVTIQGSNDNSTWNPISSATSFSFTGSKNVIIDSDPDLMDYYLYHRIYLSTNPAISVTRSYAGGIWRAQFYGRELKVSVPTMTSNTTPYGEASASTSDASTAPWRAFRNKSDSSSDRAAWWVNTTAVQLPQSLMYEFTSKMVLKAFKYENTNDGINYYVKSLSLFGSEDGSAYEKIADCDEGSSGANKLFYYVVNNSKAYKKYKVQVNTNGGNYATLANVQFYGFDYSEKEFEEGTTKKWLYDHGVELETMYTVSATKNADCITLTAVNAEARTLSAVDFSLYNLLRGKVGSHASGTAKLREWVAGAYSDWTTSNMPYANALDVSSVNGQHSAGALMSAAGTFDVSELWLE